jgi:hypothetical protein
MNGNLSLVYPHDDTGHSNKCGGPALFFSLITSTVSKGLTGHTFMYGLYTTLTLAPQRERKNSH